MLTAKCNIPKGTTFHQCISSTVSGRLCDSHTKTEESQCLKGECKGLKNIHTVFTMRWICFKTSDCKGLTTGDKNQAQNTPVKQTCRYAVPNVP